MQFGLSKNQYEFIVNKVVLPITKRGGHVYCFGSRARGDHKKFSDLDLLLDCPSDDLKNLVSQIREQIEESNFPLKVDLVLITELAKSYKQEIQEQMKIFCP